MKIKKIEFKNINSYGNNLQTITFDEDPGLILLFGENGAGKSTLKQVMDITLFSKTTGKTGKRLGLKELPNRRNGSLFTSMTFENHLNQEVRMTRMIKPNDFEITVNNEKITERFKKMSEKDRENIIGYSYEIFKSFISMNINDFKNFISLNKEDKETLLNKLFNLNELDELLSITKELDKSNQNAIYDYENLIYDNDSTISDYKQTIQAIKNKIEFSKTERIKELKDLIFNLKPEYSEIETNLLENKTQYQKINSKFSKLKQMKSDKERIKTKLELEIDNLNEKVETYESGICPVCDSNLTDESHVSHLEDFKSKIEDKRTDIKKANSFLQRCVLEDTKLKNEGDVLYQSKSSLNQRFGALKTELSSYSKEYKTLKTEVDNENNDDSTENLDLKIKELKDKNIEYKNIIEDLKIKSDTYEELKSLLSFSGIRKSLISNAIGPINKYLNMYLKELDSEYTAVLSDNFDATIYELDTLEINPETLSKGEDRKINIAIAISYLKIILEMKHSNVIFLDEIFDGLSMKNIELIINILKDLSKEYQTNIIIVAHGVSEMKNFNQVKNKFSYTIQAKKDIFSDLEIVKS